MCEALFVWELLLTHCASTSFNKDCLRIHPLCTELWGAYNLAETPLGIEAVISVIYAILMCKALLVRELLRSPAVQLAEGH